MRPPKPPPQPQQQQQQQAREEAAEAAAAAGAGKVIGPMYDAVAAQLCKDREEGLDAKRKRHQQVGGRVCCQNVGVIANLQGWRARAHLKQRRQECQSGPAAKVHLQVV